jgi:hypothetical protein
MEIEVGMYSWSGDSIGIDQLDRHNIIAVFMDGRWIEVTPGSFREAYVADEPYCTPSWSRGMVAFLDGSTSIWYVIDPSAIQGWKFKSDLYRG